MLMISLAFLVIHGAGSGLVLAQTPIASRGTLLQFNFDDDNTWPLKAGKSTGSIRATVQKANAGTIDVAGSKDPSGAMVLTVTGNATTAWSTQLTSGLLAIDNNETNLGKLTWSFNLSVSQAHPVTVRIASYDGHHRKTGELEETVYPAAADFYQRYALDLSTMKPVGKPAGEGTFDPTDPFVSFTFELGSATAWTPSQLCQLRVDNVNYARPAWYVTPEGRDSNDGRSEATAIATPQKAVAAALPGDIILLMQGTYPTGRSQMTFRRGGTPAGWITVKNYPGQHPLLQNETWNCICIGAGSKTEPATGPAIGYIEIRGLHIVGDNLVAKQKYPDAIDQADPRTNGNAITIEGRFEKNTPHHIRFADNLIENNSGGGINGLEADWITVEHNVVRDNCWWMIYAGSGISILGSSNFDATENNYKHLVRNNIVSGNRCLLKWKALKRYSDGNGIILDVNNKTENKPNSHFLGRTLVQGNISFNNGGGGIHDVKADHVDIINNTTYMNSASPELQYAEIDANNANDVRVFNNIMVAPVANIAAGEKPEPVNENHRSTNLVYSHNLYAGGNIRPLMGEGDRILDPQFVRPSIDPASADFHLSAYSPARRSGIWTPFSPIIDAYGNLFPLNLPPDLGAIQEQAAQ